MAEITFVLGGARSGKSDFAENIAEKALKKRLYIATAQAFDDEMRTRIAVHQARRNGWQTLEVPLDLPQALSEHKKAGDIVLVDCLTVWLGNLMAHERNVGDACEALLAALDQFQDDIILVACEVGLGIVPDNKQARQFRDYAGRLNSAIATKANKVFFIAAGLPLTLKG